MGRLLLMFGRGGGGGRCFVGLEWCIFWKINTFAM
jgi:hypothetical protein